MFQWIGNNFTLIFYIAIFAFPVLGSLGKWLQQQAAKKQAEGKKKRQFETQLRTGRGETSPGASAPAERENADDSRETFAERRRRQIEELKRRQEAAQRQREDAQSGRAQPSRPSAEQAKQSTQASGPQRQPARSSRAATPRPDRSAGPIAVARAAEVNEVPAEIESLAAKFERQTRASRSAASVPEISGLAGAARLDRASLRRAVVLAEVLAPPVALRNDGQKAV